EAHPWPLVFAGADQVDVAVTVYLSPRQKEHVNAALTGAVEQFARPVGEEIVLSALQQGNVWAAHAAFARQQGGRLRNRRGIADSDMTNASDQPRDKVGEQFFVAVAKRHAALSGHDDKLRSEE